MKAEIQKYFLRFGFLLGIVIPIIYFTQSERTITRLYYKISLAFLAVAICELIWILYKRVFGTIENLPHEKFQAVLIFRGILYAAIILAMGLGL
jgi:hypothetical protein